VLDHEEPAKEKVKAKATLQACVGRDGVGAPLRSVRPVELRELAGELRCVCGVAASVAKLATAHARLDEAPLSLLQLASLLRLGTAAVAGALATPPGTPTPLEAALQLRTHASLCSRLLALGRPLLLPPPPNTRGWRSRHSASHDEPALPLKTIRYGKLTGCVPSGTVAFQKLCSSARRRPCTTRRSPTEATRSWYDAGHVSHAWQSQATGLASDSRCEGRQPTGASSLKRSPGSGQRRRALQWARGLQDDPWGWVGRPSYSGDAPDALDGPQQPRRTGPK